MPCTCVKGGGGDELRGVKREERKGVRREVERVGEDQQLGY